MRVDSMRQNARHLRYALILIQGTISTANFLLSDVFPPTAGHRCVRNEWPHDLFGDMKITQTRPAANGRPERLDIIPVMRGEACPDPIPCRCATGRNNVLRWPFPERPVNL
jgi:hypothetical protein